MCKRKGPNFFDVRKYIQKCRLRSDQKSGACKQVDVSLLEYEMTILRTAANDFSSFLLVCDKNNFFFPFRYGNSRTSDMPHSM